MTKALRKTASRLLFWLSLVPIAILAVPTAILIGLIYLIWNSVDFVIRKLDNDK